MMAGTKPGREREPVRRTNRVQALRRRSRASAVLEDAVNFSGGFLIGGIIVLLAWLMIG
jgi:hypothetical protein